VVGAHARRERRERRLHARALGKPLGMHAVARAVYVAARDALVGLDQVEAAAARARRTRRAPKPTSRPEAPHVEGIDHDRAAVVSGQLLSRW